MKIHFFSCLVFFCISGLLYAQNSVTENGQEQKLLIHTDETFAVLSFRLLDGKSVTFKDTFEMIKIVPANELLGRQEKILWNTSQVFNLLTLASAAGTLVYLFADLPNQETMLTTFGISMSIAFVCSIYTRQAASSKFLQMVDNYNLYIMGIPVGKI
jgi:hypothetical protein